LTMSSFSTGPSSPSPVMGTLFAFSQLYIGLTQNARHNLGIFPAGEMEAVPV